MKNANAILDLILMVKEYGRMMQYRQGCVVLDEWLEALEYTDKANEIMEKIVRALIVE